ncbi:MULTISPECIES: glutathione synthase [unclassified Rhodococcus (in: high G+C Gram-positive bacteria)]|nr:MULTISPECIES: glutathione synthase [unclassified Rhodococcus (in: high G+C Gram-positive bacteria)]KJF19157.1 Glutathione synthetase [Rhodococcus sp. AD45]
MSAELCAPQARSGLRMDFVFIADPLTTLKPAHDTTIALMEAVQLAGHRVLATTIGELGIDGGYAFARCREVTLRPAVLSENMWIADTDWYTTDVPFRLRLDEVAAIFMRTDPPVDGKYLRATFILDLVDPAKTMLINSPSGLRDANEKLFALRMPELGPPTLVSSDRDEICETVSSWGTSVLKPTDGMAGRGIMLLRPDDPNLHSILDTATDRGVNHVVVQQFIPDVVTEGDRRVIVLEGRPIGSVRRIVDRGGTEFRCNMATGARVVPDTLTARDREICNAIGPELVRRGLVFVGIDVIGGQLTEVNVTSPTGIREIDALSGTHLAADIIAWAIARCAKMQGER